MGAPPSRRSAQGGRSDRLSRLLAATVVLLVGLGADGAGAPASRPDVVLGATLRGPAKVVPGAAARFTVAGFRPGANVEVVLAPTDRRGSIRIAKSFRVALDGSAVMSFAMPRYFRRCDAWLRCKRLAWHARERVVITASGYLQQAQTTTSIALRGLA